MEFPSGWLQLEARDFLWVSMMIFSPSSDDILWPVSFFQLARLAVSIQG